MRTYRFESETINQDEKLKQVCDFLELLDNGKSKELKNYVEKNSIRLEEVEDNNNM